MKNSGYSLVELAVTMGLVGILAASTLPTLRDVIARERLVTRSNELIGALNGARVHAVVSGRQTIVCPSSDGATCRADGAWSRGFIAFEDLDADRSLDAGETVFRASVEAKPSLAVQSTRPLVAFRASGRADGTNLTIRICHGPSTATATPGRPGRVLSVNNAGRTRQSTVADCPG